MTHPLIKKLKCPNCGMKSTVKCEVNRGSNLYRLYCYKCQELHLMDCTFSPPPPAGWNFDPQEWRATELTDKWIEVPLFA